MPKLSVSSVINVGSKKIQVHDLLDNLVYLPASQMVNYFNEVGIKFPRELRIYVLRELLRMRVAETQKSRLTLADEINYRLEWFSEFGESQLENLLLFYDDRLLDREYLEELWISLLSHMVDKGISSKQLKDLIDTAELSMKNTGKILPEMQSYNFTLRRTFYDSFGRIDGMHPAKFRPVLYKSSTLDEIRGIGHKYDVDVPRRLKKNQLADIIIRTLKDRGEHTDALEAKVRGMSVIFMQRFAIDNDIKASTELKKEEIIEYILANAAETKDSYLLPVSDDIYEQEVVDVSSIPVEQLDAVEDRPLEPVAEVMEIKVSVDEKPEPAVEPVQEEKVEPTPAPEPAPAPQAQVTEKVIYVTQPVQDNTFNEEIRKLREAIEKLSNKVDTKEDAKPVQKEEPVVVEEKVLVEDKVEETLEERDNDVIYVNATQFEGTQKEWKKSVSNEEEPVLVAKEEKVTEASNELTVDLAKKQKKGPVELRGLWIFVKVLLWILIAVLLLVLAGSVLGFFFGDVLTSTGEPNIIKEGNPFNYMYYNLLPIGERGIIGWVGKLWELLFPNFYK